MRWKSSGSTAAVLWDAASKICSKQDIMYLCSSHIAFSLKIWLESRCCSYTVVSTQLGRIPVLFN